MPPKRWVMPEWMKKYEKYIGDTVNNPIEELMNDHKTTIFENAPRAVLCITVKDQISLLQALKRDGLLV